MPGHGGVDDEAAELGVLEEDAADRRGVAIGARDRRLEIVNDQAAGVQRTVRRIVLHLPTTFPWLPAWRQIARAVGATS